MPRPSRLLPLALLVLATGCTSASVSFERTTRTSGTFRSTGASWTILGWDHPKPAMQIARENAFDAGLSNVQVEEARITPDWGWWNWALDIVSYRRASVSGTWGWSGERLRDPNAQR
jgi:hypothetical protein